MALKATIYKAQVQLADMDRHVYADHALTLACHPSETEERMMVRLLAFALHAPADDKDGALTFGKGLSDTDEPDLWQRDLTGAVVHWIDVGLPEERRVLRACSRARRVTVIAFQAATDIWWRSVAGKLARAASLAVWQLPAEQSRELAGLAQRSMRLQVTVQDGTVWVGDDKTSVEVQPTRLMPT